MRAASHIDFRTAVKMSQQASVCSGFPILTPLPTYTAQIIDECYSHPSNTDQSLSGYTPPMESNSFPVSGCLTPQTPESIIYHDASPVGNMSDQWMASQPWSDDSLVSVGLGFEGDMSAMLPTELWSTPEHMHSAPITQISWYHPSLSVSPQTISSEPVPDARAVPPLSISECSVDDFNNSGTFHEDWASYQQTATQFDMTSMVSSAPFVHDLSSIPSTAPVWEDVFMPGPVPY
jgi:hypothetical protein